MTYGNYGPIPEGRGQREEQTVTIYDFFRQLARRMTMTSESEQLAYLAMIDQCEELNIFGTSAKTITEVWK